MKKKHVVANFLVSYLGNPFRVDGQMSRFWKLDLISEYMFFISNSIFGLKFSCLGSTPILASKSLIYCCLFLLWDFAIPESVT